MCEHGTNQKAGVGRHPSSILAAPQAEEELPLKPVEHDEHEGLGEADLKEHEEVRE